ncbi:unnamed protein product [Leuciscus chuanchicus]
MEEAKWNCSHLLTFTEDVKRLHVHLDEQEKVREGEVSQMPLSAYSSSNQTEAHPDISMAFTEGSDCIREFAGACSAKNPQTLTSTKLRKQIGHDIRIHRQFYRLPEGTLQLAKMSRILLALEKRRLADFKGKNLDEIIIDPEENVTVDSDLEESTSNPKECTTVSSPQHTECEENKLPADPVSKKKRGHIKATAWNKNEIDAVENHMMRFIKNRKVPGKADCARCLEAEPSALKQREWSALKFYIKNRISTQQRKDLAH